MLDQSGSMPEKKLSPEKQAELDRLVAEIMQKDFPLSGKWEHEFDKKFERPFREEMPIGMMRKDISGPWESFPEKNILKKKFNKSPDIGIFLKELESMIAEINLTPEERRERAQAQAAELADAFVEGTAAPTAALRPLHLRARGPALLHRDPHGVFMTEENKQDNAPPDPKEDIARQIESFRSGTSIIFTGPPGVGKTAMIKKLLESFTEASAVNGGTPPPIIVTTTSEDYKKAIAENSALANRLKSIPLIPFAPLSTEVMVQIAQKTLKKFSLAPEERQALAEFIVEQYKAEDEGGSQGLRGMSKMVDEIMKAPLSAEAQSAVIKKLLSTSPLETDHQAALADIVLAQVDARAHSVGNGGRGLKAAVDKALEGPLSPDMEAVMIEKSPAYAAGVSRRNGGKLAEAFTEGVTVQPMKSIHFRTRSNPGVTG